MTSAVVGNQGRTFCRLASYRHRLPGNDVAAALAPAAGLGWGWVQAVQASQQMQAVVFHQLDQGQALIARDDQYEELNTRVVF